MIAFEKYGELQNLLLSMDASEDITKVKNFIDENQLFKNIKKTTSTLRLIGSIVYIRPDLLNNMINLLYSYNDIQISDEIISQSYIENDEILLRKIIIFILLSLTKHKVFGNLFYSYLRFTDPVNCFKKDTNYYYYHPPPDFDAICDMSDDQKIKARNTLHSIDPIALLIKDDKIEELQNFISKNNYDIENEIPSSSFEIHRQLQNAKPIEYAAFFGAINCFKFLLMKDTNINYSNLLEFAISGGNIDIIHIIENESHDENIKSNQNLLYLAILYMKNDLIDYLIHSYPIKIDAESYIKCIYASNYNALTIIKELDNDSTTINEFGDIGSTPIDIAAFEGYLDFFKFYLTFKNIDPLVYNNDGKTILQSAARSNKIDVVKYIIKHKMVEANDEGEYGSTALSIAYNYDCDEVSYFLEMNTNEKNNEEESY